MPKVAGRNTFIKINDSTGTCQNISGDGNTVTINWSAEAPETTGFGATEKVRLPGGIEDVTIDLSGYWNATATSGIDTILSGILGGSTIITIAPGGSSGGSPNYTACAVLLNYNVEAAYDGVVGYTANFALCSGSMVRELGV